MQREETLKKLTKALNGREDIVHKPQERNTIKKYSGNKRVAIYS